MRRALLLGGCLLALASRGTAEPTPEAVEFFEKKVRPVLVGQCQECHGAKKQRGGLRLDSRPALIKGGDSGPAIVPGKPDASRLIKAVGYHDTVLKMPPKSKLPDDQIGDLTAWVGMDAPWPDGGGATVVTGEAFPLKERMHHWSWRPVRPVSPPAVRDRSWPRNPIDLFLLARLEAAGLSPSTEADPAALLRRVTFDLTGLPPTVEEINEFVEAVGSKPQAAFEEAVERLLASPAYGERWGRHWLDLVRYAETLGHEFDFEIADAHQYRDYVVRAFNDDVPYDQLVREHVAGDLFDRPRRHPRDGLNESILGTGFWFFGEAKHSPVDIRGDQADRLDNQIDVFSKTFLGMTLSCARCHDHKFDALTTKDYYALVGYLQSSRFQKAYLDDPAPLRETIRQIGEALDEAREVARDALARKGAGRAGELAEFLLAGRRTAAERREHVKKVATVAGTVPGAAVFEDFSGNDYSGWYPAGEAFGRGPLRAVEALRASPANPVKEVVAGVAHSGAVSNRLQGVLRSRTFTINKPRILYRVAGADCRVNLIIDGFQLIRDPIYGGLTFPVVHGEKFQWRVQDVSMWKDHRAYIEVIDDGIGWVALDSILFADGGPPLDAANSLLLKPLDDAPLDFESLTARYEKLFKEVLADWESGRIEGPERVAVLNWMLPLIQDNEALDGGPRVVELLDRVAKLDEGILHSRRAPAMADGSAVDEFVHIRGSHKNLGEPVPRRFLEAFDAAPAGAKGSGRLKLAEQLLDPRNPLTARVMVNRLWMHHFGEGLVRSVDNFGVLGQPPTHPELLDWLADEFVRSGWSVKHLHRLMLTSSAYRMASRGDPKADERDPKNELLHRMPIRRLEAEAIRDTMLAVSGRLDRRMGDKGVMPHLTPFMQGRGRPGASGPLDGDGRRTLYLNVRRNFLTPMLLAFDYPLPFTTIGRRNVSNVPAQALSLMNNPFVTQQAERWAKRVLAEPGLTSEARVRRMYLTAFARPASDTESADALAFLAEQAKQYGRADDPRAWTDLAHVLMNVKEFIFVN